MKIFEKYYLVGLIVLENLTELIASIIWFILCPFVTNEYGQYSGKFIKFLYLIPNKIASKAIRKMCGF